MVQNLLCWVSSEREERSVTHCVFLHSFREMRCHDGKENSMEGNSTVDERGLH